jgi:uncharacterized protein (TIGR03435 family)
MPLFNLITLAHRINPFQLSAPEWSRLQGFDIAARMRSASGSVREMLQARLADRFHLSLHRMTREELVYALVAGKGRTRLGAAPEADGTMPTADQVKPVWEEPITWPPKFARQRKMPGARRMAPQPGISRRRLR